MWGAAEIGALVITCGSVLTGLIAQIQLSRCKKINLCYGACACARDLSEVVDNDNVNNNNNNLNELTSIHDELESIHDIVEEKDNKILPNLEQDKDK